MLRQAQHEGLNFRNLTLSLSKGEAIMFHYAASAAMRFAFSTACSMVPTM